MAKAISFIVVFSFLLIPASTLVESNQEGYISGVISNKGLDFAKNLLIEKAISSMVPLQLSDIEKSVKIPVIGKVLLGLSNIIIHSVDVASSLVETGDSGISLVASDATANMNMDWRYSYKTWLVPIAISDHGTATVQVQGMVIWLNAAIINQEGTLKLLLLDCGCHVKDISIKVNGGASWLYQGIIDAFQGKIVSAIEDAITKNIKEGIKKLDSKLQSLPKQMQVNGVVALNVTFVEDPLLSNSSVELKVNGLFNGADGSSVSNYYVKGSQSFLSCTDSAKMVEISLHQNVFKSAALVYFNANYMHWTVDKIPDQSLMNTDGWRYIIPELYQQYPDDDINFSIAVTSPPIIRVSDHDIGTTIYADLVIEVLNSGETVPVTCISLVISASCSAEIYGNNLAGSIRLVNFTENLKWSNIGNLQMHLVQAAMSTILETFFMPYLNSHLSTGFPLPLPHGFTLQNADIVRLDSKVKVLSDLSFTDRYESYNLNQLPIYW
ncbi:putative BPI/LBP family protein At1g04970 [Durio zibethinus]|uniref:BPI/LBP family protein At1g04970 n=1 Tax=Durio zibethinus TaxID=66656 RepID=A0A6P5XY55_DURZI|nr:putative BPI/LBP family protein At1g04970 [Durio zibethinus]